MKLHIKWATIDVESEEDAIEMVQEIEKTFEGRYFTWDYEIENQEDDPR
jgi:hypothetical protein